MFKKVTNFLYVSTQIAALIWVTLSYVVALYSTIKLGVPFPVEELSKNAMDTILGVAFAKTVANVFEHNDSKIFGESDKYV